jgi:mannose-6-phosphate isomerase-like protein (cupin superfamily)
VVAPIVVTDTANRSVEILIGLEYAVVTRSRYAAGERGPNLHVHLLHADCFYVLDGAFTLELEDGDRVLGPRAFVIVPPNVVHAFRNDGSDEVRFLNLHAPSMGFDRYVQAIGGTGAAFREELAARHDQHLPPQHGADPATVIVRTPETVETVTAAGHRISILGTARELLGAAGVIECTAAPGSPGPPLHVHNRTFDAYVVLDGGLAIQSDGEQLELAAGDALVIPPGTTHTFANPFSTPARFLDIHAPGGFEQYYRDLAAAIGDGPLDAAAMRVVASRYDVHMA